MKQEAKNEEAKKRERQLKERETKAFLDMQVALKNERRVLEKDHDQKHAQVVQADVQAFERSKKDMKSEHEKQMHAHRDSLMRQINEHKHAKATGMAPQEYAINKRIIEEVEGKSPPESPEHLKKRPF